MSYESRGGEDDLASNGINGPFFVCLVRFIKNEETGNDDQKREIVYGPSSQIDCGGWIVTHSHEYPDTGMAVVPRDYAQGIAGFAEFEALALAGKEYFEELQKEADAENALQHQAMGDMLHCEACDYIAHKAVFPVADGMTRCLACNAEVKIS